MISQISAEEGVGAWFVEETEVAMGVNGYDCLVWCESLDIISNHVMGQIILSVNIPMEDLVLELTKTSKATT